jgi:ribosome biogenesis GTPase
MESKMDELVKYGLVERFLNEATLYPELIIARVISQSKNLYKIVVDNGEMLAEVSGKFRHEHSELFEYPAVGDFIMVSFEGDDDRAVIHKVLTRKSSFERTAVGVKGQRQVIAANVDYVFICMSLNNNFNLSRLERYLSVAYNSGAVPIIVLTKSDLCDCLDIAMGEIESVAAFTDIIVTSAYDETNEELLSYLKPGITASFIGSSGVGKSTLVNKLAGKEVFTTSEIGKDDKGRHTTTRREMILLAGGATLIDTPGMRELGVESVNLAASFADIDELASQCRFSDCMHTKEPGCAVLKAVEEGTLDVRRLENYLKLKKEAKYDGLSSKEIETEKSESMFKDVGGMKGVKKHLKENNKRKY